MTIRIFQNLFKNSHYFFIREALKPASKRLDILRNHTIAASGVKARIGRNLRFGQGSPMSGRAFSRELIRSMFLHLWLVFMSVQGALLFWEIVVWADQLQMRQVPSNRLRRYFSVVWLGRGQAIHRRLLFGVKREVVLCEGAEVWEFGQTTSLLEDLTGAILSGFLDASLRELETFTLLRGRVEARISWGLVYIRKSLVRGHTWHGRGRRLIPGLDGVNALSSHEFGVHLWG